MNLEMELNMLVQGVALVTVVGIGLTVGLTVVYFLLERRAGVPVRVAWRRLWGWRDG